MNFEELNARSVAIRAKKITFDYFTRVLTMVIEPEYGAKEEVRNKIFCLQFENCLYLGARNSSSAFYTAGFEFITWGKINDRQEARRLIKATSGVTGLRPNPNANLSHYETYFFQDPPSGDTLVIISSGVIVTDSSHEPS